MKLYLVTLNEWDYDFFDEFVVVAKSAKDAIKYLKMTYDDTKCLWNKGYKIKEIKLGEYKHTKEILSSFRAG